MGQPSQKYRRLPHPGVQKLLLWGFRLLTPFLLSIVFYITDTPTLLPSEVGEILRTFLWALVFLIGGSFYIDRQLSRSES